MAYDSGRTGCSWESPMAEIERERLSVDGTVKQLANKDDPGLFGAFITVEGDSVRATWDGTDPVASTTGHLFAAGDSFRLNNAAAIQNFKVTQETGAAALEVTYDNRI